MKEITEMSDVHNILFEGLCYFDKFCKKNHLNYFLSNGTLLGAAKYGDFIAWDDDVDIMMFRQDYDKLMRMKQINNENYRLLCREQSHSWKMPYAKLSCEQTILKEGEYDFGEEFGLNIDVFPIDNWHPCAIRAKMQSIKMEFFKRFLIASIGKELQTEKQGLKKIILSIIWKIGKQLGNSTILQIFDEKINKAKKYKSKYAGCVAWTCHMTKEVFPVKIFEEKVYLTIRNRQFPTFGGYEYYLNGLYGNWRAELPTEQQHSNHVIKVWWKYE